MPFLDLDRHATDILRRCVCVCGQQCRGGGNARQYRNHPPGVQYLLHDAPPISSYRSKPRTECDDRMTRSTSGAYTTLVSFGLWRPISRLQAPFFFLEIMRRLSTAHRSTS